MVELINQGHNHQEEVVAVVMDLFMLLMDLLEVQTPVVVAVDLDQQVLVDQVGQVKL